MPVREVTKINCNNCHQKNPFALLPLRTRAFIQDRAGLTFGRYEGFAARRAPSHRVHLGDAEVPPEVLTGVVVEALVPQESLEP